MPCPDQCAQIAVKYFDWTCWHALWSVRIRLLAEHGITIDPATVPAGPLDADRGDPEWDLHHMSEVYLSGAGGFWLAWRGGSPAGYVGAQDLGPFAELRRMFVCPEDRRAGVGTRLVGALLHHCAARGVPAVELWTDGDGLGRRLYERLGFVRVPEPGMTYGDLFDRTGYEPGAAEVRMRLDLAMIGGARVDVPRLPGTPAAARTSIDRSTRGRAERCSDRRRSNHWLPTSVSLATCCFITGRSIEVESY